MDPHLLDPKLFLLQKVTMRYNTELTNMLEKKSRKATNIISSDCCKKFGLELLLQKHMKHVLVRKAPTW